MLLLLGLSLFHNVEKGNDNVNDYEEVLRTIRIWTCDEFGWVGFVNVGGMQARKEVEEDAAELAVDRPTRGVISSLTGKARGRMMKYLLTAKARYTGFVTLTTPHVETDGRLFKKALSRMLDWMLLELKKGGEPDEQSIVWVLEFQERGAPHVHALVTGWIGKAALSRQWAKVLFETMANDPSRSYDLADLHDLAEKARDAGTSIEAIRSKKGIRVYMAKYAAKAEQKDVPAEYRNVGRFWGVRGNSEKSSALEIDIEIIVPKSQGNEHKRMVLCKKLEESFDKVADIRAKLREWRQGAGVHVYRNGLGDDWWVAWEDLAWSIGGKEGVAAFLDAVDHYAKKKD